MTRKLTLSVGQLVAFACRSGDLAAGPRGPTAIEGIRAHQRWQRHRSSTCQTEVPVKAIVEIGCGPGDSYAVTLQGRIDVLCDTSQCPQIEEIKSCYCTPEHLSDAHKSLHWAQLKVYGFLYLHGLYAASDTTKEQPTHALQQLQLCMTWLQLPHDKPYQQERVAHWHELQQFTFDALACYVHWQHAVDQQRRACQSTAAQLNFPYPAFREGQRTMAAYVFRALRDGKPVLCEAPTGIGKTISALFPAVKALGTGHVDQIIYLTAKNSGREAAKAALAAMIDDGLDITYLVIQAKQHACACSNGVCDRDEQGICPRCPGFFDRLPTARETLLRARHMDIATIASVAEQFQLCPFELSLQMLPWSTVVICDYNYAFDPLVALTWPTDNSSAVGVLLDEAHNLVDRARQMYSARLNRQQLRHGADLASAEHPAIARGLQTIDRALARWHQYCAKEGTRNGDQQNIGKAPRRQEFISKDLPTTVLKAVQRCSDMQASLPAEAETAPYPPELVDCLREVYRFGAIAEQAREHHRTISRRHRKGRSTQIELKLQCLNASSYLTEHYDRFQAIALFSATLAPLDYYHRALGLNQHCAHLALPSPFAPTQQATLVCGTIDTRYRQRQAAIPDIVDIIERVVLSKPGNYLVFFASYQYMLQVAETLHTRCPEFDIQVQQRDADEHQRADFLKKFSSDSAVIGCAIMGGVFGEAVDYPGDKLLGAIIVGTGLPGISTEQELIREDYEASGLNGFDFAYRYPGLSRVLQAAGRVIRSECDHGAVILIDQRFATSSYRRLLPRHWHPHHCASPDQLGRMLAGFWRNPIEPDNQPLG